MGKAAETFKDGLVLIFLVVMAVISLFLFMFGWWFFDAFLGL